MTSPFLTTDTRYGREETYVDRQAFAKAIAPLLGASVPADNEPGEYGTVKLDMGDGLFLTLHRSVNGKVEISAWAPGERELSHYDRPRYPTIGVSVSRPLDVLARDIKRRVIDPSLPLLAEGKAKIAAKNAHQNQVAATAARFQAAFPTARIQAKESEASLHLSGPGGSISGSLKADGSIYVQHLSLRGDENLTRALLALLVGETDAIPAAA